MELFSIRIQRTFQLVSTDQIVILYNSLRPHASCDWLTPLEAELRTGKLKHHWGRKTVVRKAYVNLYQDNIF